MFSRFIRQSSEHGKKIISFMTACTICGYKIYDDENKLSVLHWEGKREKSMFLVSETRGEEVLYHQKYKFSDDNIAKIVEDQFDGEKYSVISRLNPDMDLKMLTERYGNNLIIILCNDFAFNIASKQIYMFDKQNSLSITNKQGELLEQFLLDIIDVIDLGNELLSKEEIKDIIKDTTKYFKMTDIISREVISPNNWDYVMRTETASSYYSRYNNLRDYISTISASIETTIKSYQRQIRLTDNKATQIMLGTHDSTQIDEFFDKLKFEMDRGYILDFQLIPGNERFGIESNAREIKKLYKEDASISDYVSAYGTNYDSRSAARMRIAFGWSPINYFDTRLLVNDDIVARDKLRAELLEKVIDEPDNYSLYTIPSMVDVDINNKGEFENRYCGLFDSLIREQLLDNDVIIHDYVDTIGSPHLFYGVVKDLSSISCNVGCMASTKAYLDNAVASGNIAEWLGYVMQAIQEVTLSDTVGRKITKTGFIIDNRTNEILSFPYGIDGSKDKRYFICEQNLTFIRSEDITEEKQCQENTEE